MNQRTHRRIASGLLACFIAIAPSMAGTTQMVQAAAKVAYLTFDDGPDPVCTPMVLDVLRRLQVHATFFVIGFRSEQYPSLVRRIHREGHEIGNHGYYHTFIVNKTKQWVELDVRKADAAIEAVSGIRPQYFRPPGGILSQSDAGLVTKIGHPIAMWTVDTNDWKATSEASIVSAVRAGTRPGAIILMHDGITTNSRYTAKALPTIIHDLRAQGYTFEVLPKHFPGEFIGGRTDMTNYRFHNPAKSSS